MSAEASRSPELELHKHKHAKWAASLLKSYRVTIPESFGLQERSNTHANYAVQIFPKGKTDKSSYHGILQTVSIGAITRIARGRKRESRRHYDEGNRIIISFSSTADPMQIVAWTENSEWTRSQDGTPEMKIGRHIDENYDLLLSPLNTQDTGREQSVKRIKSDLGLKDKGRYPALIRDLSRKHDTRLNGMPSSHSELVIGFPEDKYFSTKKSDLEALDHVAGIFEKHIGISIKPVPVFDLYEHILVNSRKDKTPLRLFP